MANRDVRPEEEKDNGSTGDQQGLTPELQQHIGSRLRALYDGVVNEPIPDRFMDLLNQLDQPQQSGGQKPSDSGDVA